MPSSLDSPCAEKTLPIMCLKPEFPQIEGLKVLDEGEAVPTGMALSDEKFYDLVTGDSYRVAFDSNKVSVVGWSTYDFGELPEGLQYLGSTGLGGYDLYHKPA